MSYNYNKNIQIQINLLNNTGMNGVWKISVVESQAKVVGQLQDLCRKDIQAAPVIMTLSDNNFMGDLKSCHVIPCPKWKDHGLFSNSMKRNDTSCSNWHNKDHKTKKLTL